MSGFENRAYHSNAGEYIGGLSNEKPEPVPNPGYFQALRSGSPLPIGTWTRYFHNNRASDSYVTSKAVRNGVTYYDETLTGVITAAYRWKGSYAAVDNQIADNLLTEATAKAKTASWDILTFAAEANKTYDLVTRAHNRTWQRVHDIGRAFATRKSRVAITAVNFASAWLEYRYGWRILMYDLKAADDSVQRLQEAKSRLERYTAHHRSSETTLELDDEEAVFWLPSGTSGAVQGLSYTRADHKVHRTTSVDYRAGVGVLGSSTFPVTMNPLLTAWELVPFSFVIDWFLNVGEVIGANTPTLGRETAYSWLSFKNEIVTDMVTSWYPYGSGYFSTPGNSGLAHEWSQSIKYHRQPRVAGSLGLNFNPNLDLSKWVDLVSLVLSRKSNHDNLYR